MHTSTHTQAHACTQIHCVYAHTKSAATFRVGKKNIITNVGFYHRHWARHDASVDAGSVRYCHKLQCQLRGNGVWIFVDWICKFVYVVWFCVLVFEHACMNLCKHVCLCMHACNHTSMRGFVCAWVSTCMSLKCSFSVCNRQICIPCAIQLDWCSGRHTDLCQCRQAECTNLHINTHTCTQIDTQALNNTNRAHMH